MNVMGKRILVFLFAFSITLAFGQPTTYTNRIGMAFVLIPPGSIVIGRFDPPYPKPPRPDSAVKTNQGVQWTQKDYQLAETLVKQDADTGFSVMISRSFYIGKFEVTQTQWQQVMGTNPSAFQGSKVSDNADEHPVEQVTWQDTQKFLARLNALDKEHRYRLPTEFEWEYAARAGATDDIPWKTIWASAQMGSMTTSAVGKKAPNAWGLYDTLGNVWEWVQDAYNGKLFATQPGMSNRSSRLDNQHVLKGASFVGDVKNATYMTHAAGPGNGWDVGFRVVMEPKL